MKSQRGGGFSRPFPYQDMGLTPLGPKADKQVEKFCQSCDDRPMKKSSRFLLCLSVLCVTALLSPPSWAQQQKGQYVPAPVTPPEEGLPPTVPRIFSSKVTSVRQAEKLDLKYHDLTIVLNGYAELDASYRQRMFEQIQPFKFQVTRRKEEFSKDIEDAKRALKDNYKKTKSLIEGFQKELDEQSKFYTEAERETIRATGEQAIKSFEKKSGEYFKLQANFIKTYSQLVRFILANGGSYYYDSGRKGVAFYNPGHYNTFVKYVDDLKKIDFDQAQLIKSFAAGPPL